MRKVPFTKLVASGNDFVLVEEKHLPARVPLTALARMMTNRTEGIGADGLLVVRAGSASCARMRIFNADGSEAEMCGNGARCVAYYLGKAHSSFLTAAGRIEAALAQTGVRVHLTDPFGLKEDLPIRVCGRTLRVNVLNTGVPHAVVFVNGLEKIPVFSLGRAIRFHRRFAPAGTNVNFVEPQSQDAIRVRTYERGVEDETGACGTGSVAAALIFSLKSGFCGCVKVHTASAEVLRVYFEREGRSFRRVWLEGSVRRIGAGTFFVPSAKEKT